MISMTPSPRQRCITLTQCSCQSGRSLLTRLMSNIYAFQNVNYTDKLLSFLVFANVLRFNICKNTLRTVGRLLWGDPYARRACEQAHGLASDAVVNVKRREMTMQYCLRKRVRNECENA